MKYKVPTLDTTDKELSKLEIDYVTPLKFTLVNLTKRKQTMYLGI